MVASFAFLEKSDHQIKYLSWVFETQGGGKLNKPIFISSNAQGGSPEGGCWSFKLIDALMCDLRVNGKEN